MNKANLLYSKSFLEIFFRTRIKKQVGSRDLIQKQNHVLVNDGRLQAQSDSAKSSAVFVPSTTQTMTPQSFSKPRKEHLTSTAQKPSVCHISNNGSKLGSPIPCGDSFFEEDAVLTQTHVNFMSRFSRHSLNSSLEATDNSSSATSTPVAFPRARSTPFLQKHSGLTVLETVSNSTVNSSKCLKSGLISTNSSLISPNRPVSSRKPVPKARHYEPDMFDSIDEDMNLNMAEEFEFNYNLSNQSVSSKPTMQQTGSSIVKGNGSGYLEHFEDVSKNELIDEFDDDDDIDFNQILSQDDLPQISRPKNSRQSTGLYAVFYNPISYT